MLPAAPGEAGVGDGELEVLGHLVAVVDLAHLHADLVAPDELAGLDAGGNPREKLLGGLQQALALVRAEFG